MGMTITILSDDFFLLGDRTAFDKKKTYLRHWLVSWWSSRPD